MVRLIVVVIVSLFVLTVRVTKAQESTPEVIDPAAARLLFVSERDGNREIYTVFDDGTRLMNFTNHPAEDAYPVWSPDGSMIAFQSDRDGNWDVFVMNADGTGRSAIFAEMLVDEERPSWSINGDLSVQAFGAEAGWQLFVSADAEPLTTDVTVARVNPVWSPDGRHLAFRQRVDTSWQLYVADVNEVHVVQTQITPEGADVGAIAWSPDSRMIAFERNGEIYTVTLATGEIINLTVTPAYEEAPMWSPDGAQIVYASNWDIFIMNADGSGVINLTNTPTYDVSPAWSPDGGEIAFSSYRDEDWELYEMDYNGCNLRRLTDARGRDQFPQWQPSDSPVTMTERLPAAVITTAGANLRSGAGENFAVVGSAAQNECLTLIGRSADSAWLNVRNGEGLEAWVATDLVRIVGNIEAVPNITP